MRSLLLVLALCSSGNVLPSVEPAALIGGGNFTNGQIGPDFDAQIKILHNLGATRCRINLYPGTYLVQGKDWDKPNTAALDKVMDRLHEEKIVPMLLLEYYTHQNLAKIGLGTEAQWQGIGKAFASRYRPGGEWAKERNITDGFGISLYTAFNEPEPTELRIGGSLGPKPYAEALRGYAAGVHAADPALQIVPGGYMAANAWRDWSLRGIAPEIAPLLNDGSLAGIDLHTYYDVQWAPMERSYTCSAQNNFDMVKIASGVTRDIEFFSTEFNFKNRICTPEQSGSGMLTGIWDHLAIVGNDGRTLKSQLALPWNIFHTQKKDEQFGLILSEEPFTRTSNGVVLKQVLDLCRGMKVVAADPRRTGMIALRGADRTMWVWQNLVGWTDQPGTSLTLSGVPANVAAIDVYTWQGKLKTIPVTAGVPVLISELPIEQTCMFVAAGVETGDPETLLPERAKNRITLSDLAASFAQKDVPVPYRVVAHETFDIEATTFKKWTTTADAELIAIWATPDPGTCAQMTFTMDADKPQTRLLAGTLGSAIKTLESPKPQSLHLRFMLRGSEAGRRVRVSIVDRDGDTIMTQAVSSTITWERKHVSLQEGVTGVAPDKAALAKPVIDFPVRSLSFEILPEPGLSPAGGEKIWIHDAQIIEVIK